MGTSTLYREIFEPTVTALAPRFADRSVMVTKVKSVSTAVAHTNMKTAKKKLFS